MKTIEQKLERVMEIGVLIGMARPKMLKHADEVYYSEWLGLKSSGRISRVHMVKYFDTILALWMEFNEIVEGINNRIPRPIPFDDINCRCVTKKLKPKRMGVESTKGLTSKQFNRLIRKMSNA